MYPKLRLTKVLWAFCHKKTHPPTDWHISCAGFRRDHQSAIERDHAATASYQTTFKIAKGRNNCKVAVQCDWGITH